MSTPVAVEYRNVRKSFGGVPVLRDVSFAIPRGHTLGLVGENGAGKSTLMNLLGGNLRPDDGEILLSGSPHRPDSPAAAARAGVAFIHQELNLFPNLTIAENVFLTAFPRKGRAPLIARGELHRRTAALLQEVGLEVAPDTPVERLSAGQCQLVEIARALGQDAQVLILDEPTTSLGAQETAALFALMAKLKAKGMTMIYISHLLEDVRRLCDDVVVLRDGALVGQGQTTEFTTERLISLMVGRSLTQLFPTRSGVPTQEPLLSVRGLSEPGIVRDLNFTVHRGEIVGVAGLMGAGRSEMARLLFGLDRHATGAVELGSQVLGTASTRERIAKGLAFLTEDRRTEGLCLDASIRQNLALVTLRQHATPAGGLLNLRKLSEAAREIGRAVRLTEKASADQPVSTLSGGNQQKVVLGKWLLARPRVLILDEPTRGVDVGARYELYQLILRAADEGSGVLVISSDIEELIGLCDRILVMCRGEIRDEVARGQFDRERILQAALPTKEAHS